MTANGKANPDGLVQPLRGASLAALESLRAEAKGIVLDTRSFSEWVVAEGNVLRVLALYVSTKAKLSRPGTRLVVSCVAAADPLLLEPATLFRGTQAAEESREAAA